MAEEYAWLLLELPLIPEPDHCVNASRRESVAVGAGCDRSHPAFVPAKDDRRTIRLMEVPDLHGSIVSCRDQPLIVVAECHGPHLVLVARENGRRDGRMAQIPEADRVVEAGRRPSLPVPREGEAADPTLVALEDPRADSQIMKRPKAHSPVAAGGQGSPIGTECDSDASRIFMSAGKDDGRGIEAPKLPQPKDPIFVGSGEPFPVRADRHGKNREIRPQLSWGTGRPIQRPDPDSLSIAGGDRSSIRPE